MDVVTFFKNAIKCSAFRMLPGKASSRTSGVNNGLANLISAIFPSTALMSTTISHGIRELTRHRNSMNSAKRQRLVSHHQAHLNCCSKLLDDYHLLYSVLVHEHLIPPSDLCIPFADEHCLRLSNRQLCPICTARMSTIHNTTVATMIYISTESIDNNLQSMNAPKGRIDGSRV